MSDAYYVSGSCKWSVDNPPLCVVCGCIAKLGWPLRGTYTCNSDDCILEVARTECSEIELLEESDGDD